MMSVAKASALFPLIRLALLPLALTAALSRSSNADEASAAPFAQASQRVDQFLDQAHQQSGLQPAGESSDAEFCRRVWLDLAGVAPPVWSLRSFLADQRTDKRDRLIESLLDSPRFATHMANRWNEFLLPADATNDRQIDSAELHRWLRKQFLADTPYDHVVGGFLTAGGKSDRGPAIFYTSRDLEPVKLASATSRLFLGVQLECAQCHPHPFARWTQDDFWSFAAFFSQLELVDTRMAGGQAIADRPGRQVTFPDSDRVMAPRYPGVAEPPEPDPQDFRRRQLTIWLASRNNPYFARAAANRVWAHLFGRGLVDPVDAMDDDNPPSHPELLQYLADYFVEERFDLKSLYGMLARTKAYGRSSAIESDHRPPPDTFAAMNVKTLSAEQFFDSLQQNVLLGNLGTAANNPDSIAMVRREFVTRMKSAGTSPTEYPHGVVQALGMMNGPEMLAATGEQQSGLIASLDAPFFSDGERIETLFLACLSRPPTDDEQARFNDYLNNAPSSQTRAARLSDLTWILLNTAECFVCP